MDRFKIKFRCVLEPGSQSGLKGFQKGKQYEGRSFNGLFEVHPSWGKGTGVSRMLDQKTFNKFFELIRESVPVG